MLISPAVLYCFLNVQDSAVRRTLLGREIVPRVLFYSSSLSALGLSCAKVRSDCFKSAGSY